MKWFNWFLLIFVIILLTYITITPPKVSVRYVQGLPDTVIIRDTVRIPKPYRVAVTKIEKVYIDTTGNINLDSIQTDWIAFNLESDTTTGCIGKVRLKGLFFEFDSVKMYYPKMIIKQVDTVKYTVTEKEKFYENKWFWISIVAIVYAIAGGG